MSSASKRGLLDLPPEVRCMIYPLVFHSKDYGKTDILVTEFARGLSRLLRTCRTIYDEARPYLYQQIELEVPGLVQDFTPFFDQIGTVNLKWIQHLCLEAHSLQIFPDMYLESVADLRGLLDIKNIKVYNFAWEGQHSDKFEFRKARKVIMFAIKLLEAHNDIRHMFMKTVRFDSYFKQSWIDMRMVVEGVKKEAKVGLPMLLLDSMC
jgi:hypothetical protein